MRRGVSRQVTAMFVIAWINGVLAVRRVPLWIVSYLLMPLTLLFFLTIYGGAATMMYALIGGVIMVIAGNGIAILGDAAFYRIYLKYQDLLVATPIRPVSYIIGLSLSVLVFTIPGLILFIVLMGVIGMLTLWFSIALTLCSILLWTSTSFMGFAASTLFRRLRHVWPLATILSILLSVVPPVYYPVTLLPSEVHWVGALAPTGAAAIILHYVGGLAHPETSAVTASVISLIGYNVVFILLSLSKMRWREK
ncbi:MAG: ABC transporter permease [Candidatus Nezhaarchaeota archaeon]|nr:ABC transporter permease [Candidatus Nezhaarchaeota archaeon]MCX8142174.1 ABC transporter permease [Candidatus Nezhaarchaeota archaeon]MDW8050043.1 ABC transporter permease [Nitrososphaerota archaeon]